MKNKTKNLIIAVCLVVAILGSYFLIKPHGFIRYITDTSFEYEEIDGGIVLTKYTGENRDIIIPSKIDGKSVLSIEGAFASNTEIRNVQISEGVISVDYMAFWHCISLESVTLPSSVETIGHATFNNCISLEEVRFGKNLVNIMPYAFTGCVSLSDVKFYEGLRFIGENAFDGCTSLGEITLPSTVAVIGGTTEGDSSDEVQLSLYKKQIGSTERESFSNCGELVIKIDENNPYYKTENGKIVSKR